MATSIGDILNHGIAFDPKNWGNGIVPEDAAASGELLLDVLDQSAIEYTLVGGLALLTYFEGRNTQDIDIIARLEDLRRVSGFSTEAMDNFLAKGRYRGLRVDVLRRECPVFKMVAENFSEKRRFGSREVPTATAEGMMLLKLFALPSLYRQFQMDKVFIYEADLAMLLNNHPVATEPLLSLLEPHVLKEDVEEMRTVIADIERKLRRGRPS